MEEYLYRLIANYLACPVTWGHFPDGQGAPRAALNRISQTRRDMTLQGEGLFVTRLQVDLFAESAGAAIELGRQVVDLLDGHQGGQIQLAQLDDTRDGIEGDLATLHRVTLTFTLTHSR